MYQISPYMPDIGDSAKWPTENAPNSTLSTDVTPNLSNG